MKKGAMAISLIAFLLLSSAIVVINLGSQAFAAPKNRNNSTSTPTTDNTRPSISITSPSDGATVFAGNIVVTGKASDSGTGVEWVGVKVDSNHYQADAVPLSPGFGEWSAVITITTPGSYRLTARADDFANNLMWDHVYITVVAPPKATITMTPPADVYAESTGATTAVSLGTPYATSVPTETLQVTNNAPSGFKLGSTTVTWTASDSFGDKATALQQVTVTDTKLPSVAITSPADGSTMPAVPFSINVQGTSSDSGSGVAFVQVSARLADSSAGDDYVMASTTDNWKTWHVSLTVTNPDYTRIIARVTDNAGNVNWLSINLVPSASGTSTGGSGSGSGGTTGGSGGTTTPPPSTGIDKFGIKELYATKNGGNEWYVNMADPKSDPAFRNLPTMIKQADGSWQVSATQVRMEAWSPSNEKWLNIEITEYAKMVGGTNQLLQLYSRGGHHTSSDPCLGSAIKARLYGNGEAKWVKELTHPAYTGSKGTVQATTDPLLGRWVGFKAVIYNVVGSDGKTYVHMESYIDNDVTDANGNLQIKNNWKLASVVEDKGGWGTTNTDFDATCFPTNKDSTQQYRQRDEILNTGGGTSTQNIAAWRSDDLTWNWKYLSVREIEAPL